jgi:hypothetical protein
MAYEIGYVDNTGSEGLAHWQMLLKIKTFAEANGWTTLRYLNPTDGSNRELIMKGVGLSGAEEIFVGFRSYHDATADYYNLSLAGFTGYVPGNTFITQPGYRESGVPAHNQRVDYWLVANAQRITFAWKVGVGVYQTGYVGKMFPFGTPGQYPYPLVVAGMLIGVPATRYSATANYAMPYYGNRANLAMRFLDGTWKQPFGYPYSNTVLAGNSAGAEYALRDSAGIYPITAVALYDNTPNVYGKLDGISHMSGFNTVVEDTMTIDGTPYVVIRDTVNTGFNNYLALELS